MQKSDENRNKNKNKNKSKKVNWKARKYEYSLVQYSLPAQPQGRTINQTDAGSHSVTQRPPFRLMLMPQTGNPKEPKEREEHIWSPSLEIQAEENVRRSAKQLWKGETNRPKWYLHPAAITKNTNSKKLKAKGKK